MPELSIQCVDCPTVFTMTEDEQQFYKDKNLSIPKRCKPCRVLKRQEREKREGQDRQY